MEKHAVTVHAALTTTDSRGSDDADQPAAGARCDIAVEPYRAEDAGGWEAFVRASNNGTLFHDLRFLGYHAPGRFDVHHLIFRRAGGLAAVLPAAIVRETDGRLFLKSPYGASIGGPALPAGQHLETTLDIVAALQDYVSAKGLAGIEMRLGPGIYACCPSDNLAFALTARGFAFARRWLCHVIALPPEPAQALTVIPTASRRRYARYAVRQGVTARTCDASELDTFYRILAANRAKHGVQPTHTLAELQALLALVPERIKLFLFTLEAVAIAGALVFELNPRVAYMFYLCHDDRFERHRATSLAIAHLMEHYATRGFRYLDLGPSTFDDFRLNPGLAEFKEEFGAVGFCRDEYRWETTERGH